MMVNSLFPCVMQVVDCYKESLWCKHLYFNIEFVVFASVMAFSGTILGEHVRARDRSPTIEFCFQARKY